MRQLGIRVVKHFRQLFSVFAEYLAEPADNVGRLHIIAAVKQTVLCGWPRIAPRAAWLAEHLAAAVNVGRATAGSAHSRDRRGDPEAIRAEAVACGSLLLQLCPELDLDPVLRPIDAGGAGSGDGRTGTGSGADERTGEGAQSGGGGGGGGNSDERRTPSTDLIGVGTTTTSSGAGGEGRGMGLDGLLQLGRDSLGITDATLDNPDAAEEYMSMLEAEFKMGDHNNNGMPKF